MHTIGRVLRKDNDIMKRNMPTFINVISESKFEILEEIIDSKYSQFTTFYWLLRNYSDSITKLKYKESKKKNAAPRQNDG